ncbi:Ig-like domain-containing protein [Parasediminibacterium sp. JCM 36343]|uniref:Ig-like domain-containing protein n=1 Tax=Parasediminibacterium sp. JCM 36343 TaxID=3374279 RepID=UPI0039783B29
MKNFIAIAFVLFAISTKAQDVATNHTPYPKDYYFEYYDQGYFVDTDRDKPVNGKVTGVDEDRDHLSYALKDKPINGNVSLNVDGYFTYTPNIGFIGLDSFYVAVIDTRGAISTAIVRASVGYSAADFMEMFQHKYNGQIPSHPRLVYTDNDFSRLLVQKNSDEFLSKTINNIIAAANKLLKINADKPLDPKVLLRDVIQDESTNLSLAYKLTGDAQYLKRFVEMVNVVCDSVKTPSWGVAAGGGEISFGQILNSFILAYDFLYNDLPVETRTKIEMAVIRNCYAPAYQQMIESKGIYGSFNNYNGIGSSGFAFSAMALCDAGFGGNKDAQLMAQQVLAKCVRTMQRAMVSFMPDGAYYEGLGYGMWLVRNLIMPIIGLRNVFNLSLPDELTYGAYYKSPDWFLAAQGGAGEFGNGEDGTRRAYAPTAKMKGYDVSLLLAKLANKPEYAWLYYKLNEKKGGDWQTLLYYDKNIHLKAANEKPAIKDVCFKNYGMAILHSDYGNEKESAISLYNGSNIEWHLALEEGTVQLNALGTQWFAHIGGDNYSIPHYGQKSNVYRKRAEGRNTLVINPFNGPDQEWSRGRINSFGSNDTAAFAIANITKAYAKNAVSVIRGVMLFNNKKEFLIQDEIKTKGRAEIYSFFHTAQSVKLDKDKHSAILTDNNGNRLYVELLSPLNAELSVMDAVLLPTSPHVAGQTPNDGFRKLTVHLNNVDSANITLWAMPLLPNEKLPTNKPSLVSLSDWR